MQFSFSRESAECLFEGEGGGESPKNLDNVKTAAAVFELETKEFIHLEGKYSLRWQTAEHPSYILHNINHESIGTQAVT